MTREERHQLLGSATLARIRRRVAAAPPPPPELVDELRRIFASAVAHRVGQHREDRAA